MASYRAGEGSDDSDEEQGQAFYAGGSDTRYSTVFRLPVCMISELSDTYLGDFVSCCGFS